MRLYTDDVKGVAYIKLQEQALTALLDGIDSALSKTSTAVASYNVIANIVSQMRRDLPKLIINGAALASALESIFIESVNIGVSFTDSYSFHARLFQTDITPEFEVTSSGREMAFINLLLVSQAVNIYALSNALVNISQITFSSAEDIESILSDISKQYTTIINRNRFTKLSQEQIELIEIDAQVSDQVADTTALLQASEIGLPKQQIVNVTRNSLIPLTYKFYGDIPLRNTLARVNRVQNPLDLRGEFKVLAV